MNKINLRFKKVFSSKDQIYFINRLYFLLNSGIPILESLDIIENQTKNKKKKILYREIVEKVSEGSLLSSASSHLFNSFISSLIRTGEQSGFLVLNLGYLSEHLKKKRALRRKILEAITYPLLIGLVTFLMVFFLIFYIFPKILPVISGLRIELPLSTQFIIWLSEFLSKFWLVLIILFSASVITFILIFRKNAQFKFFIHKIFLFSPILGLIYRDFFLSSFCHHLNLLHRGGMTIDEALNSVKPSINNVFLSIKIDEMRAVVLSGNELSKFLFKERKIFSEDFAGMISVGEKTGNLEIILGNSAEFYEEQFSSRVKNFSQMLEPALMIIAGLIVGFVAISIISPIYEITNNL